MKLRSIQDCASHPNGLHRRGRIQGPNPRSGGVVSLLVVLFSSRWAGRLAQVTQARTILTQVCAKRPRIRCRAGGVASTAGRRGKGISSRARQPSWGHLRRAAAPPPLRISSVGSPSVHTRRPLFYGRHSTNSRPWRACPRAPGPGRRSRLWGHRSRCTGRADRVSRTGRASRAARRVVAGGESAQGVSAIHSAIVSATSNPRRLGIAAVDALCATAADEVAPRAGAPRRRPTVASRVAPGSDPFGRTRHRGYARLLGRRFALVGGAAAAGQGSGGGTGAPAAGIGSGAGSIESRDSVVGGAAGPPAEALGRNVSRISRIR